MNDIERPNIKIIEEKTAEDGKCLYGRYEIQPLIRGFGTTLGNSLRRILISSVTGSAVVYLQIDKVLHEFHSIEGVVEDVTDIVLNLKGLSVSVDSDEVVPLLLDIKGIKDVKAGDFQADDRVQISDPNYPICTVTSENTKLKMEVGVRRGRGYMPVEWHKEDPDLPSDRGIILIDSNYSPVVRTKFNVSSARVGQRTDFDKLEIDVTTDGSVSPADALSEAARILIKEFSFIVDFKERILLEEEKKEEEQKKKGQDLKKTIDELDLSVRSYNCLKSANILTVEEVVTWSELRLRGLRNFGEKSLKEIKEKLISMGLNLMDDEV